jgi:hypothetical protein
MLKGKVIFLSLLLFYGFSLFSQNHVLRVHLKIGKTNIFKTELPVKIKIGNETSPIQGRFDPADSSYIFLLGDFVRLNNPYSFLVVNYDGKLFEVPLDGLYRIAYAYPEFRNRPELSVELTKKKALDKYAGVFGYLITNYGASNTGYGFYETKKSFVYKREMAEFYK